MAACSRTELEHLGLGPWAPGFTLAALACPDPITMGTNAIHRFDPYCNRAHPLNSRMAATNRAIRTGAGAPLNTAGQSVQLPGSCGSMRRPEHHTGMRKAGSARQRSSAVRHCLGEGQFRKMLFDKLIHRFARMPDLDMHLPSRNDATCRASHQRAGTTSKPTSTCHVTAMSKISQRGPIRAVGLENAVPVTTGTDEWSGTHTLRSATGPHGGILYSTAQHSKPAGA